MSTSHTPEEPSGEPQAEVVPTPPPEAAAPPLPQTHAAQVAALEPQQPATGPIGRLRGTGFCIAMTLVTLGIYSCVWYYQVHDEMKRHTREGLGGGLALVLVILVGFVMPFLSSAEVGNMYERRGEKKPVSGTTGLWYIPGILLLLVGPFVWFVKTNGALNSYWRSLGAR